MQHQKYQLRLHSRYLNSDNDVDKMTVEIFEKNEWQAFDPDLLSPGFMLLVFALLSCQHRYMKTNCAERNLILDSSVGELQLLAATDWTIKSFHIDFKIKIKSGTPNNDDVAYIRERMTHCPVSTNLSENIISTNAVQFEVSHE